MRRLGLVGLLCLVMVAGLVALTSPAQAFTVICTGKTKAQVAKCDTSGYAQVMDKMHWRMYGGHNCTNYAAYRMMQAGVPEPKILMGNARDWAANARKLGYVVDQRPAQGAIAQWSKAASHVAYVEEVGADYLVLSEDSYTSKTYRRYKVLSTDSWYPERFIHFKDVGASVAPMKPTVNSTVSVAAPAKVSTRIKPTVTVKVAAGDGKPPVGTLRVRRGGVTVATASLPATANGVAKVKIPRMKRGTQWISAVFDGNTVVRAGASRSVKVVVTKPPKVVSSKTTITPPAGQVTATTRAKLQLTVASKDGRAMTNAVSVYVDGKRVASPVLKKSHRGKVTVTLPLLSPGNHRITATYWGCPTVRRSKAAARTIKVVEPTTTAAALDKATIRSTETASVTATVTTARGVPPTAGEVWATVDGVRAAAVALTPAAQGRVTIPLPVTPGAHEVVVGYGGAAHQLASTAAALPFTVTQTTVITVAGPAAVAKGARANFAVRVRDAARAGLTAGRVRVFDGTKQIATGDLAAAVDGKITLQLPVLAPGAHQLSAVFDATTLLLGSTSRTHALTVRE